MINRDCNAHGVSGGGGSGFCKGGGGGAWQPVMQQPYCTSVRLAYADPYAVLPASSRAGSTSACTAAPAASGAQPSSEANGMQLPAAGSRAAATQPGADAQRQAQAAASAVGEEEGAPARGAPVRVMLAKSCAVHSPAAQRQALE
jgi:hypothetical protein